MIGGLPNSLRLRLIMGSAVAVLASMLLAGLFIGNLYRLHTTDRFKTELDHHLSELVAMVSIDSGGRPRVAQPLSDPQFNVVGSGLYWQIDAGNGRLLRSHSLGRHRLAPHSTQDEWESGHAGQQALLQRSVRFTIGGRPVIATMASARDLLEEQVGRFRSDLTLSMVVIGLLLLGGAIALVRFGLAPVRRLGDEVDRLRHGQIERLDPDVPAEFAPVVARFNALLDGQAQLITRARTESGNLAHNLRTPLALITDEAEQLRLAGHEASAAFLLARCETMRRQIDYHLARAAAAGMRGAGTLTEVAPLLAQIIDAMRRLHADRRFVIETELPPELRLPCDRGDLAEILSNLIDNACKWAGGRVIVAGDIGYIEVRDDGPGITPDKRAIVLGVGTRLNPEVPGSGLGLAATADLLRFYDGELALDTAPEGGLRIRASFPRSV